MRDVRCERCGYGCSAVVEVQVEITELAALAFPIHVISYYYSLEPLIISGDDSFKLSRVRMTDTGLLAGRTGH